MTRPNRPFRIVHSALCIGMALCAAGAATAVAQDGQYRYADLGGTAYFDTGYMVKANSVFRFKMASRTSTASYQALFADYVNENTQTTRVIVNQTSATDFYFNFRTRAGNASSAAGVVSARGDPVEGVLSSGGAVLNGRSFALNNVSAPVSTATMKVGGWGSNANCATRFWYFIIEEDGTVLHNYVPYREGAKVGIKDLMTGTFLENASSGGTVTLVECLAPGLKVDGSPAGIGGSSPAYGFYTNPPASLPVSAPAVWTNAVGTIDAVCAGWKLYDLAGAVISNGVETSFTYEHPNPAEYRRLEWQWTDVREHGWRFDTSAKTLTELGVPSGSTPWVFGGTLSGTNVTLSSVKTAGSNTTLDFRQPIVNSAGDEACALVALWGYAFSGNATLVDVALPDTIADLPNRAFFRCSALRHVRLPSNLATVGAEAFNDCTALESIEPFLPATVTNIGATAFCGDPRLSCHLTIGGGGSAVTFGGGYVFASSGMTSVTMRAGVTSLPSRAFYYCTSLRHVRLSPDLATIDAEAFSGCAALETVEPCLPATVTSIGSSAFAGDTLLSGDIVIDGGGSAVTFVGGYAFSCGPGIRSVALSTNVASLPGRTFWNGTGLEKVLFDGWTTWAGDTFASIPAGQCRFIVPAGDAGWAGFIADASKATTWENLTDAQRASYAAAYPGHPDARAYTKAAPANQWIVSYGRGVAGESDLLIDGQPVRRAAGLVSPSYGTHTNVAALFGVPAALTAPRYADEPTIRYQCAGYQTASASRDGEWTNVVEHALADPTAPAVSYTPPGDGLHRVTWFWEEAAYTLTVSDPTDSSVGGTAVSGPLVDGYYASNSVVTVTAAPGGATFVRWSGDVPAGHETDNPLALVMDRPKRLVPEFATEWVYDSGTKTVTDGYWTLNATLSGTNLTVGTPKVAYAGGLLDLAKPVRGGYVFAAVADSAFNGNAVIRALRLPHTGTAPSSPARTSRPCRPFCRIP